MTQSTTNRLVVTTPNDTDILFKRTFNAPRALVFDALTMPEHISRWFGQPPRSKPDSPFAGWRMEACEVDLRPGGSYRYQLQGPKGEKMTIYGAFHEVQSPERLVYTETFEEYAEMGESVCTMTLEEQNGKTMLTLIASYPSKDVRDGVIQTGMEDGAAESYDALEELLQDLQRS